MPSPNGGLSDDVLAPGCWFRIHVSLNTPLVALRRNGEYFPGPIANAPIIAGGQHGGWEVRTKTLRELGGVDYPNLTSTIASPIGPVTPEEVIPFLVAFREIAEANLNHRTQVAMLLELAQHAQHGPYWQRFCQAHEDFPYSFFYLSLTQLPGIGRKTARALYEGGIHTREDVVTASLETLSALPGVGKARAQKLQQACQA